MLKFLRVYDVQIKTTRRNPDTFATVAQKRKTEVPAVGRNGKQRECVCVQSLWKAVWR